MLEALYSVVVDVTLAVDEVWERGGAGVEQRMGLCIGEYLPAWGSSGWPVLTPVALQPSLGSAESASVA